MVNLKEISHHLGINKSVTLQLSVKAHPLLPIPQGTYLLCLRILSRAFIKCWSFCFSNHFCNNSFCFRLSYHCSILSFIMLWSYFHIRRRRLDIWTHADSSMSSALLSNVGSTPWEAFSLLSFVNFGWGWLGGSFFFCWFLVQNKKLSKYILHTCKATYHSINKMSVPFSFTGLKSFNLLFVGRTKIHKG